jgi:hypothetical protein
MLPTDITKQDNVTGLFNAIDGHTRQGPERERVYPLTKE